MLFCWRVPGTKRHFDAIVIGAGQAGPSLAGRLSAAGMQVAVIERKLFGGTCVNTGCIPTKTMIASAYAAQLARRAAGYGVSAGPIAVDMKAVKKRKDEISGKSRTGIESWLRGMKNCTVFTGQARFESAREVRTGDDALTADRIFLNVGGRASVGGIEGVDQVSYLTNSSMMDVDFLPEHLVVVGGSYIGVEFAQMFRRFGSEVTIVERGERLVGHEDEDVSRSISEILEAEGIRIRTGANCLRLERDGSGVRVHVNCASGEPEIRGSHVLLAIGRRPNTDDLGLDRAGVETDERGYIRVNDRLETNVEGIWALGDCNGRGAFTHTSYNDFEIVAGNLLDDETRRVTDRIPAYAIYTDPPLGRAGMTEHEVRAAGRRALIGTRPMSKVGRAVEKGESQGFMKILVDAESQHILGASILGVGGDEAIHCILDTMYAGAPFEVLKRAVHIHPTVCELIPTVLGELKPLS